MRWIILTVSICVIGFLSFQLYWSKATDKIEKYPFKELKKVDGISIRQYEARLFVSVTMKTNVYEQSSKEGFSKLAGYIFGNNSNNQKIAMTSPVSVSLEDTMSMRFMIPKGYKKEDLPNPNLSEIGFIEESDKKVAVIRFGGWANSKTINEYKENLTQALQRNNIPYTNKFWFLGYNPPFEVMNRKNEIMVELSEGYEID